jgi:MYXO-CTERM domain-containing protein
MPASTRACGRSRFGSVLLAGCALAVVAELYAACAAGTDSTERLGTSSSALTVTGLFATGVDATGARLAIGAVDPHYVLSSNDPTAPGPNALTVTPIGAWAPAGANSRWISIRASTTGATGDTYTYTTTFTLAGVDPATATLSGRWACDDSCVLRLNGTRVATDPAPAWFVATAFTVPAGSPFQLGTNTLEFVTTNTTGGPTGLQVLSITGTVSGCDADNQCLATQYCDTASATCVSKLPNGAPIPTVAGHSPPLTGACTANAGSAVCTSGVCDTGDNECGLANGDGPCTSSNGASVCRSGACSVAGTCEPAGGCNADGDCTGGDWCDEATHVCTAKLPNGSSIPSDPTHTSPTLDGTCTAAAASLVCVSGVCDVVDNRCGLADGDGPCTAAAATVCRSGTCGAGGTCGSGAGSPDAGPGEEAGVDAGPDAGEEAGAGADADASADAGADAGAGADADASADAGADAGAGADAATDAGASDAAAGADASESLDASPSEAGPDAGGDASAIADASARPEAGAKGADAAVTEGEDGGQVQGGALQGGGLSCGVSPASTTNSGGAALWALLITFAAAGRGRRKR